MTRGDGGRRGGGASSVEVLRFHGGWWQAQAGLKCSVSLWHVAPPRAWLCAPMAKRNGPEVMDETER